jgi:FKBP-type peptidyl-prolyl cis-trans isomerase
MKNMRSLLVISALCSLVIFSCGKEKKLGSAKLKTADDTASYYLGLAYGSQMKQAKFDSLINIKAYMKGLTDATKADSLPISQFEMQRFLNQYFSALEDKMMKKEFKTYIEQNEAFLKENGKKDSVKTTASGVQYIVLKEGKGPKPTVMDRVKVNYKASLLDGTEFDSSYKRGEPAIFPLRQVFPGWQEAVMLMPVGSKYRVFIPANLAYGSRPPRGSVIKPFSTLVFEIELLEILPQEKPTEGPANPMK